MARTNVGRGGRGGRGLSDHAFARGLGQKSRLTPRVPLLRPMKPYHLNSDTGVQEPEGEDEPNMDVSQRRRGSNIIEQVPNDPSKRTMISLDGGEFTDPKVSRKITSILKTMFNGSWTTWKEVDDSARDELWAHFKELFKWEGLSDVLVHDAWENCMKKRYPDIMSKARRESMKLAHAAGVQFEGGDCSILKPYNPEWIKSKHWEDMIDRVWNTPKWSNKAISGSKNRNTMKEGFVSKHCAGSITISQHKRIFDQVHKCPPTAAELFELTHTKNGAFITLKSEKWRCLSYFHSHSYIHTYSYSVS